MEKCARTPKCYTTSPCVCYQKDPMWNRVKNLNLDVHEQKFNESIDHTYAGVHQKCSFPTTDFTDVHQQER